MELIINIQREVEIPVFSQESYRGSASEIQETGSSVVTVKAILALSVVSIVIKSRLVSGTIV
jgi:hypothetical protein